ncbi:hypothetical protein IKE19_02905 [Candidatus Saccharibacteria bacterium]|nr:hypothetical protein [Candidatus Saccharibacteria bacterium]
MFLQKSRNNDEFARCCRGRIRTKESTELLVAKWRSCEHLFVLIRDVEHSSEGGFHSSDYETTPARYECVKCGLTNRLEEMEDSLDWRSNLSYRQRRATDESIEWKAQQPKISDENLLDSEPIDTCHPGVLFDVAIELCLAEEIRLTKKNVFITMQRLCDMETLQERLKISSVVHASALIERYKRRCGLYEMTSSSSDQSL